ncbi:thioredoxin family protein [Psychroflexus sediminis]|uniref:AhpC/TSA family protein n=1 Tax=Psychroflexus sediminis TaxID=470826 RepID=A0A1G7ZF47_9FLAO|nr:thioredoxin family protein [Psychroflexus sediminis]SDH07156.1 AhpC/TSA family protein [Psychroflexus sediminis]
MSLTSSAMLKLGTKAPHFELPDSISRSVYSLEQLKGEKGTVIMFISNHCPYVKHVNEEIVRLANDYRILGFGFVAISSNDVKAYPLDHPEEMFKAARQLNYPFPYLYDETQDVARAYQATCTPDFFVFDEALQLVYRGQLDDSRPKNGIPTSGRSIREALDALMNNRAVSRLQKPSMGCSIKWRTY